MEFLVIELPGGLKVPPWVLEDWEEKEGRVPDEVVRCTPVKNAAYRGQIAPGRSESLRQYPRVRDLSTLQQ